MKYLCIFSLIFSVTSITKADIYYNNTYMPNIKITSWKTQRDQDIVKQAQDFSCGAASIATVLNGFYGKKVTEKQILDIMNKKDGKASFDDMEKALVTLGFKGKGLAVSFDTLTQLKVPVIAYIKHRKSDHFTVISGISSDLVQISDPTLGKKTLNKYQFMKMWSTRSEPNFQGKVLAILPKDQDIDKRENFFIKNPHQPSISAIRYFSSQH